MHCVCGNGVSSAVAGGGTVYLYSERDHQLGITRERECYSIRKPMGTVSDTGTFAIRKNTLVGGIS